MGLSRRWQSSTLIRPSGTFSRREKAFGHFLILLRPGEEPALSLSKGGAQRRMRVLLCFRRNAAKPCDPADNARRLALHVSREIQRVADAFHWRNAQSEAVL
jgi:hypothetical protein